MWRSNTVQYEVLVLGQAPPSSPSRWWGRYNMSGTRYSRLRYKPVRTCLTRRAAPAAALERDRAHGAWYMGHGLPSCSADCLQPSVLRASVLVRGHEAIQVGTLPTPAQQIFGACTSSVLRLLHFPSFPLRPVPRSTGGTIPLCGNKSRSECHL